MHKKTFCTLLFCCVCPNVLRSELGVTRFQKELHLLKWFLCSLLYVACFCIMYLLYCCVQIGCDQFSAVIASNQGRNWVRAAFTTTIFRVSHFSPRTHFSTPHYKSWILTCQDKSIKNVRKGCDQTMNWKNKSLIVDQNILVITITFFRGF